MAQLFLVPNGAQLDEDGNPFPTTGLSVTMTPYYEEGCRQGDFTRVDRSVRQGVAPPAVYAPVAIGYVTTQLASVAGVRDGQTLSTIGWATAGDSGGAQWRFALGVSSGADGYTKINASNGQWSHASPGPMNVRSVGARGDGATDDYAALRAAVGTGRPLLWPPGVYLVEVPPAYWADPVNGHAIRIADVTGVSWEGYGATLKMGDDTWYTGRTANLKLVNCTSVVIKGLTFDGNRTGRSVTGTGGASCVDIEGGSDFSWQDVTILNACMEGLHIAPVTPATLSTYPSDMVFANLTVDNAYRNGVATIGWRRCRFPGIRVTNTNGTAPEFGFDAEPNPGDTHGGEDLEISGHFEDNAAGGVLITGSQPVATDTGGTGNGTVTDLSSYGESKTGTYVLSCIAAAAHGGTFRLTDPDGVIVTSSLVMNAGAGVGTYFRAGGLQFKITDGTVDFGTNKTFSIVGGQTCTRGVKLDVTGKNNGGSLVQIAAGRDIIIDAEIINQDDAIGDVGLVEIQRTAHGCRVNRVTASDVSGVAADKFVVYVDDTGIGHSVANITARNVSCGAFGSPNTNGLEVSNVNVDGCTSSEQAVAVSGFYQKYTNLTFRRCVSGYSIRVNNGLGNQIEGVSLYDCPANTFRVASAGATIRRVRHFVTGNAPGAIISFDAGATPLSVEDVEGVAAGTPWTPANVITLPTSTAFRAQRINPNPFSGIKTAYNPGAIGAGASVQTTVTMTSAAVGDKCKLPQHSVSLGGCVSTASITALNTATVTITNPTGGGVSPGSHDIYVELDK